MAIELDVMSEESFYEVTTQHAQELTVSRGYTWGRGQVCIWVSEGNANWPLVLESDADAVRLASMLLEATLDDRGV